MPARASIKRPRDPNLLAKSVGEDLIGKKMAGTPVPEDKRNPAAVALSKLGASKGGKARAEKLSGAATLTTHIWSVTCHNRTSPQL